MMLERGMTPRIDRIVMQLEGEGIDPQRCSITATGDINYQTPTSAPYWHIIGKFYRNGDVMIQRNPSSLP